MIATQYKEMIIRAVDDPDTTMLDLIALQLSLCEQAREILRAKGYGVIGTSIVDTARMVPNND